MSEPVTTTEAAEHLRLDTSTSPLPEQATLSRLITAARQAAENYLNRTIVERTRYLYLDAFTPVIELPFGDVSIVDEIRYIDTDGMSQTVVDNILSQDRLTPDYGQEWPDTRDQIGAVTITYTAGYNDISNPVPDAIKQAILLSVGDMYDNREAVSQGSDYKLNPTVVSLLHPYRINQGI